MAQFINLLEILIERLINADPAKGAFFPWDEVKDWPSDILGGLVACGLLRPAQPMASIECDGCEESCFMPVVVYPAQEGKAGRAFINCDKRDDIGRVRVEFDRMKQWQITGRMLASSFAAMIGVTQTSQADDKGKRWALGMLKGNLHKAQVTLNIDGVVSLDIAGHNIPLLDVLTMNSGEIAVDQAELIKRVDKPAKPSGASEYKPTVARREARKLDSQAMYESWRKEYRALKKKRPNMSEVWYSQQIAKMDIAKNRKADTIKKHMQA